VCMADCLATPVVDSILITSVRLKWDIFGNISLSTIPIGLDQSLAPTFPPWVSWTKTYIHMNTYLSYSLQP
jgi:hypothetical protein